MTPRRTPLFTLSATALAITAALGNARAETLDTVTVEGERDANPGTVTVDTRGQTGAPTLDGGGFLRQINGISAGRMSQHGLEPVIRGQQQTRINVMLDGAYIHGGCPNRMDPPSSFAVVESFDAVTVEKGVQSVLHGGGGSGGTVRFERRTAERARQPGIQGEAFVGGSDNGLDYALGGDVIAAGERAYVRAFAERKEADDYEDGDGNEIPASFDTTAGGLIAGFRPAEGQVLEAGIEASRTDDVRYAGRGMDGIYDDADTYRVKYRNRAIEGAVDGIRAEVYRSEVDHLMDNYSLRPAGMMKMETPTESDTTGGRLVLTSDAAGWTVDYGVDLQNNERTAFAQMPNGMKAFAIWPDAEIRQTGLFAEGERVLAGGGRLTLGLRHDWVEASMDDELPKTRDGIDDQEERNLGGLARIEQPFGDGTVFAGLSRSVRTADATERFVYKKDSWEGVPDLDPETHHQVDVGIDQTHAGVNWSGVLFYDDVGDYILETRESGVRSYRNIDAHFMGLELDGRAALSDALTLGASLAWVRGQNDSDNRDLPQIPPLNGQLSLDYQPGDWSTGARLRFADDQNNVDPVSGMDTGPTPGYAVLDLYGHLALGQRTRLRLGMDNVFDRTYAEHVNEDLNALFGQPVTINEPGRTIWARIDTRF